MTAATTDSHYDLQMKVKARRQQQLVQHLLLLLLAILVVVTRLFIVFHPLPLTAFLRLCSALLSWLPHKQLCGSNLPTPHTQHSIFIATVARRKISSSFTAVN